MTRSESRSADLAGALSALTGRNIRIGEVISALDVGRSTYYEQRDTGRLISADNVIRLAAAMDLNPVELLLHCGLITSHAVVDCAAKFKLDAANPASARTTRKPRFQRRLDAPPI